MTCKPSVKVLPDGRTKEIHRGESCGREDRNKRYDRETTLAHAAPLRELGKGARPPDTVG